MTRTQSPLRRHIGDFARAKVPAGRQRQAVPLSQLDARDRTAIPASIVWYYQHVVDHWDLDHPFERLLVDTAVAPDASEVTWINPVFGPASAAR